MTGEALKERKRKHTAGTNKAVSLLCRADEVHSLRGIAPLNPSETESVAIRRLSALSDGDKVVAEALR